MIKKNKQQLVIPLPLPEKGVNNEKLIPQFIIIFFSFSISFPLLSIFLLFLSPHFITYGKCGGRKYFSRSTNFLLWQMFLFVFACMCISMCMFVHECVHAFVCMCS